jgi:hypothetical protein
MLAHANPVVRALALLDGRYGKRRLAKFDSVEWAHVKENMSADLLLDALYVHEMHHSESLHLIRLSDAA